MLAPMSALACRWIFFEAWPSNCCVRFARPWSSSSSAMTRIALSDAMKLAVAIRESCSTMRRSSRRNSAPLAPVVAMVRFLVAVGSVETDLGKNSPGGREVVAPPDFTRN